MIRHTLLRATALALLVAMVAGPLGLWEVLHPADDALCEPATATSSFGERAIARDDWSGAAEHRHCAVCHVMRSAGWALTAAPVPVLSPQPTPHPNLGRDDAVVRTARHPGSGRSPPSLPAVAA